MGFECCRKCESRVPGCHDECGRYAEAKKAYTEKESLIRKNRHEEFEVTGAQIRRKRKKER